jgi:hypothetical protein
MLYMVIERFKPGAATEIYRRLHAEGRDGGGPRGRRGAGSSEQLRRTRHRPSNRSTRHPGRDRLVSPSGGVLIEGGGMGLCVTAHLEEDEDITFVKRGTVASPASD